jgi:hypothetical protein
MLLNGKAVALLLKKLGRHLTILGARRMTWRRIHAEDPQALGTTVQNVVTVVILCLGFVYPYLLEWQVNSVFLPLDWTFWICWHTHTPICRHGVQELLTKFWAVVFRNFCTRPKIVNHVGVATQSVPLAVHQPNKSLQTCIIISTDFSLKFTNSYSSFGIYWIKFYILNAESCWLD